MRVFGISDLHLSFGTDKPMIAFGKLWKDYEEKIKQNWLSNVKEEDVVIIPGDISWAMRLSEALNDFKFINALPGRKIILRGNHDYYFATKTKMEQYFTENGLNTIDVLHNNAIETDKYIICGTRGWGKTENKDNTDDAKIIAREELRLKLSLDMGVKLQEGTNKEIIVALHFPPFIRRVSKNTRRV